MGPVVSCNTSAIYFEIVRPGIKAWTLRRASKKTLFIFFVLVCGAERRDGRGRESDRQVEWQRERKRERRRKKVRSLCVS